MADHQIEVFVILQILDILILASTSRNATSDRSSVIAKRARTLLPIRQTEKVLLGMEFQFSPNGQVLLRRGKYSTTELVIMPR